MTRTVESSLDQPNDELRLNISDLARYYYLQDADLGYNIHTVTLEDGTELEIEPDEMQTIEDVFESLSDEHQDQFEVLFSQNRETNTALRQWVRSVI